MDEKYKMPDLSYHNGSVTMQKIKDAGCKRVAIRAGYGQNNIDKKYVANGEGSVKVNLPVMLYWFSYAYTADMATQEAAYAVAQAKKYWSNCPIAFDWEYDSMKFAQKHGVTPDKTLITNMAIAFLNGVKAAGYIPVLYTNEDYYKNYFDLETIKAAVGKVYVWYARYTSKLPTNRESIVDIWQYTSGGYIDGVSGRVDLNKVYTDFGADAEEVSNDYYPIYTGVSVSIITALRMVGESDTTYSHRKQIAEANGITKYRGTATQNTTMVKMLRNGTLKRA